MPGYLETLVPMLRVGTVFVPLCGALSSFGKLFPSRYLVVSLSFVLTFRTSIKARDSHRDEPELLHDNKSALPDERGVPLSIHRGPANRIGWVRT